MSRPERGGSVLCSTLEQLGIDHVFGVPGSQNVDLFDRLGEHRRIRVVLTAHELGAAFMANGYYRAKGRPAALLTIPGPGFTYALTGLAEAKLDSVALLYIVRQPPRLPARKFQLQAIDQATIAGPLVKRVIDIERPDEVGEALAEAHEVATSGEPGPVLVHLAEGVLSSPAATGPGSKERPPEGHLDEACCARIATRLNAARRPLLFLGQGAVDAADDVVRLAEKRRAAVVTTTSARGIVPEDHELALAFDVGGGCSSELNRFIADCDLVVALGCKFSHNGSAGFSLRIPEDRLIHINPDAAALDGNYPASEALRSPVKPVVRRLLTAARPTGEGKTDAGWESEELARRRRSLATPPPGQPPEPAVHGVAPATAAAFFTALRAALPRDGILVTDSGLHQMLARRHFPVLSPRGLIVPTDFQSMGFGIPAAIGAKLAAPGRVVVALVGDGGFIMSATEILTAVRERIPLTVIVFNDGQLNLIRMQQLADYGRSSAVSLHNPDFEQFAHSVGANYACLETDGTRALVAALQRTEVTIVEVRVGDTIPIRARQALGTAKRLARRVVGPGFRERCKALLRPNRPEDGAP